MRPFVQGMADAGLSYSTINRHLGNLFLLGGEIIRRVHGDADERKLSGRELILHYVDEEGGPYCRHLSTEEEAKPIDATCKKLYRYLQKQQG